MATNQTNFDDAIQAYLNRADWRRRLVDDYDSTASSLLQSYQRLVPAMREAARDFNARLDDYAAANNGETPTAGEVRRWGAFQRLLDSAETEMNAFAALVDEQSGTLATNAVATGIDAASDLVNASAGGQAQIVASVFNRPDPLALAQTIRYVESDAFQRSIAAFGENASANLGDVILAGITQGKNPTAMARVISNWLTVPYSWAESMTRTMQLWSYRQASIETYRQNAQVVSGWMWWAQLDANTCLACLQQHGSTHTLGESLNGHHRCRCTPLPIVIGSTWQNSVQTGAQWFDEQPEATQREIMGRGRYELYTGGMWDWNRASTTYYNDVFGLMRRETTLRELR